MSIKIVSDSSCDIWNLEGVDFETVALTISTAEKTYVDDYTMNVKDMLDYLAQYNDRSYTACPGIEAWLNAFGDASELYVLTLTSGLSGTYNSALTAKEMYLGKHPDAKVFVIDSLSTSSEQLLLIEKIRELILLGTSFEDICNEITKYQKTTRLFFAFQSLHNFAQNGRIPKILAKAIGVLGINVIGTASEEGTVKPISKCRGTKTIVSNLMGQLKEAGYKGGKINICHVENEDLALSFKKGVKEVYPDAEVKITPSRGLVAYYAERGGIVIGCEC